MDKTYGLPPSGLGTTNAKLFALIQQRRSGMLSSHGFGARLYFRFRCYLFYCTAQATSRVAQRYLCKLPKSTKPLRIRVQKNQTLRISFLATYDMCCW